MITFKNESAFTRWFCDILEKHNAKIIAFVGSTMQGAGITDRYICHNEFRGWVEFKKDKGKVSIAQRLFMQGLVDRGDTCGVVRYLSKDQSVWFESYNGRVLCISFFDEINIGEILYGLQAFIQ